MDCVDASCFALLPKLSSTGAQGLPPKHLAAPRPPCVQVRVLQCVSATVELMGDRVAPHLATITNALPQARASACTCSRLQRDACAAVYSQAPESGPLPPPRCRQSHGGYLSNAQLPAPRSRANPSCSSSSGPRLPASCRCGR